MAATVLARVGSVRGVVSARLGRPATNRPSVARVTLDDVQALMEELYGEADRARGLAASVAWLCEEVGELAQAVRKGTPAEQLHELGDVVAWTASIANQLGLSLAEALDRYAQQSSDGGPAPAQTARG
jgi:NTP pyrophosphatase (non-canonical NTP hydrolase)